MRHVQRRRGNSINQRAVATFIAYELSDYLDQDIDPATIKDIDELTLISPRFEATDSTVTLIEGGELISMNEHERAHIHHPENTMWQLAIKPPVPIRYGQVHRIRYRIDLNIDHMLLEPDDRNYASLGPLAPARFNVSLALTFDAPPRAIIQKIWSHTMKDESLLEVVELPAPQVQRPGTSRHHR